MQVLSDSEKARPIMEYVRSLESKVLTLRRERQRFQASIFLAGIAVGVFATLLFLRYLR